LYLPAGAVVCSADIHALRDRQVSPRRFWCAGIRLYVGRESGRRECHKLQSVLRDLDRQLQRRRLSHECWPSDELSLPTAIRFQVFRADRGELSGRELVFGGDTPLSIWHKVTAREMAEEGIALIPVDLLTDAQLVQAADLLKQHRFPTLTLFREL